MNSKNILLSKTFWMNILGLAVTASGAIPNTKIAPIVLCVANIGLRLITNQPINLFGQNSTDTTSNFPQTK